jgi:uncharacterized membrane protein YhaH (DUF805 family)
MSVDINSKACSHCKTNFASLNKHLLLGIETLKLSFLKAVINSFKYMFKFTGRARRKEIWYLQLFYFITFNLFIIINSFSNPTTEIFKRITFYTLIYALFPFWEYAYLFVIFDKVFVSLCFIFITCMIRLSSYIRRLHDFGMHGKFVAFLLLPAVGTVIHWKNLCNCGDFGKNDFGFDPLLNENVQGE